MTKVDVLQQARIEAFGDADLAFLANNDNADEAKRFFGPQAQQLPNAPWGLKDGAKPQRIHPLSAQQSFFTLVAKVRTLR
jgi:hypothetical protein